MNQGLAKKRVCPWQSSYEGNGLKYARPENNTRSDSTMLRLFAGASAYYATLNGKPLDNEWRHEGTNDKAGDQEPAELSHHLSLERFGFRITKKGMDLWDFYFVYENKYFL